MTAGCTPDQAAEALRRGRLAILPTETVYGLAADAADPGAVAAVYEAKGRPSFNPLIASRDSIGRGGSGWPYWTTGLWP